MNTDIYFKSLIENHVKDQDFLWHENPPSSMRKGGSISKSVASVCGYSHLNADSVKSRAVLTAWCPSIQTESCEHDQYTFYFFSPILFFGGRRGPEMETVRRGSEVAETFGVAVR